MIINIRGTNGSGKTTLARAFQGDGRCELRKKLVPGHWAGLPGIGMICSVGSYVPAQGGMDTVPNFATQQAAVAHAAQEFDHVLCEGVLAATVSGSWLEFLKGMHTAGHDVLIGYMDTPVTQCLANIADRQERAGKVRPIKEDLVRDKYQSINRTRTKFEAAGIPTMTLHYGQAEAQLREVLTGAASCRQLERQRS